MANNKHSDPTSQHSPPTWLTATVAQLSTGAWFILQKTHTYTRETETHTEYTHDVCTVYRQTVSTHIHTNEHKYNWTCTFCAVANTFTHIHTYYTIQFIFCSQTHTHTLPKLHMQDMQL